MWAVSACVWLCDGLPCPDPDLGVRGLLILSTFELQKPTTKAITLLGGIALLVGSGIQISSDWGGAAGGLGSLAIGILLIWIGVEIMKRGWKKYVAPAPSPPA
ncbi:MAG: hypothetical protein QXH08_01280 [Candidatus Hadarchaeales archaeon]